MPLKHDLGRGRHAQLAAHSLDQFSTAAAQESGELVFRQTVGHGRHRPQYGGRVSAQRDGDGIGFTGVLQTMLAKIQRAAPVGEPAHDELVRPDHLLAVDTQILPLLIRAPGNHQPPGN